MGLTFRKASAIIVLSGIFPTACVISAAVVSAPTSQQTLSFLNQTIDWYRHLSSEEQLADQPTDVLFVYNDRDIANQVLSLSFDFARANAHLLAGMDTTSANTDAAGSTPNQYQNIAQLAAAAQENIQQKKQKVDALKQQLQAAKPSTRRALEAEVDTAQSAVDLAQARSDALANLVQFSAGVDSGAKGSTLLSQISELEQSVPGARAAVQDKSGASKSNGTAGSSAAPTTELQASTKPAPTGILGLASDLWSVRQKTHALDGSLAITNSLQQSSKTLIAPLTAALRAATKQGDDISNEPETTDPQNARTAAPGN